MINTEESCKIFKEYGTVRSTYILQACIYFNRVLWLKKKKKNVSQINFLGTYEISNNLTFIKSILLLIIGKNVSIILQTRI